MSNDRVLPLQQTADSIIMYPMSEKGFGGFYYGFCAGILRESCGNPAECCSIRKNNCKNFPRNIITGSLNLFGGQSKAEDGFLMCANNFQRQSDCVTYVSLHQIP